MEDRALKRAQKGDENGRREGRREGNLFRSGIKFSVNDQKSHGSPGVSFLI